MKNKILLVLMLSGMVQIMNASAARATNGPLIDGNQIVNNPNRQLFRALSIEGVQEAIRAGANINDRDENGRTLLVRAVRRGEPEYVRKLLSLGADPKIQDNEGHDAAYYADLDDDNNDYAFDRDDMNEIKNALDEHETHAQDAAKLDEYVDPSEIADFPNTEGLSEGEIRLKILEARRAEQQAREQADSKKSEFEQISEQIESDHENDEESEEEEKI